MKNTKQKHRYINLPPIDITSLHEGSNTIENNGVKFKIDLHHNQLCIKIDEQFSVTNYIPFYFLFFIFQKNEKNIIEISDDEGEEFKEKQKAPSKESNEKEVPLQNVSKLNCKLFINNHIHQILLQIVPSKIQNLELSNLSESMFY